MFLGLPPVTEDLPDGRERLVEPVIYTATWRPEWHWLYGGVPSWITVTLRPGLITDYLSIPRVLWPLIPRRGPYGPAGLLHDGLYQFCLFDRHTCDALFFQALKDLGIERWKRTLFYLGVRLGGWWPYGHYMRRLEADRPPLDDYGTPIPHLVYLSFRDKVTGRVRTVEWWREEGWPPRHQKYNL